MVISSTDLEKKYPEKICYAKLTYNIFNLSSHQKNAQLQFYDEKDVLKNLGICIRKPQKMKEETYKHLQTNLKQNTDWIEQDGTF